MLSVDEALREVLKRAAPLPPRLCDALEAVGCLLAEDVSADLDLPPFDKALVDGYAVRAGEVESGTRRFTIGEEIAAGQTPKRDLGAGEAALIMTGAPIPQGADAVVMIEHTKQLGPDVVIDDGDVRPGMNVLRQGRELKTGEVVLRRGDRLNASRIGLLASVGRTQVQTIPRPIVRIVPTGDELVDARQKPGPSQIRNSNAAMLAALTQRFGGVPTVLPIANDDRKILHQSLEDGLEADVLIVTGGVSAGNRDLVPDTLESLGVERVFHKIKVKPGKPLWFGVGSPKGAQSGPLVFGLPGNPVSGIVGFLLFVRPAIAALIGQPLPEVAATRWPLARPFRHSSDRPTYFPARRIGSKNGSLIDPLAWAGSADLRTVAGADGFAVFPAGDYDYAEGDVVDFLDLD